MKSINYKCNSSNQLLRANTTIYPSFSEFFVTYTLYGSFSYTYRDLVWLTKIHSPVKGFIDFISLCSESFFMFIDTPIDNRFLLFESYTSPSII